MVASSPLTLHAAPAAGFEQPFEMLDACHERVRRMLRLLQRLQQHLVEHGTDAAARDAATDVMRYFDRAGPEHHEDEERHLFPRLAISTDPTLRALVNRLQDEHLAMERQWARLRGDLLAVRAGQPVSAEAPARWAAFVALYGTHIEAEDGIAYPAARALVATHEAAAMGREMAQRRGVPPPV
jgi:hemerythrin-like domain-containing protein